VNSRRLWVTSIVCAFHLIAMGEEATRQASRLLETGSTRQAKAVLLSTLSKEPQNATAHELLGDVYRHEGNATGAAREYRRALELGIRDSELLSNLATVDRWTHHFSEARKLYKRELEFSPFPREDRKELDDLDYQRGLSVFNSYGGWETDSTTKGWQAELFYGGLDRIDPYAGASYSDKFFYTRRSYYGKAYAFLAPAFYTKFSFEQDNYNYPVVVTPVPDANAYRHVPTVGIELSGKVTPRVQATIAYEFFRPTFFFQQSEHASNHKVSGEVEFQTPWRPLSLKLKAAALRDPDPARTLVDKSNHVVVPVYGKQVLVGGGAQLSLPRLETSVLMLPNRDLDRSTSYSFLSDCSVSLRENLKLRAGHVYDNYSSQSVFSGKVAQVYNAGLSWKAARWTEISFGGKVVRRPIRDDQAIYITTRFRLPIR
jgi:tetratricopeptide (TPR) repeat protein